MLTRGGSVLTRECAWAPECVYGAGVREGVFGRA